MFAPAGVSDPDSRMHGLKELIIMFAPAGVSDPDSQMHGL